MRTTFKILALGAAIAASATLAKADQITGALTLNSANGAVVSFNGTSATFTNASNNAFVSDAEGSALAPFVDDFGQIFSFSLSSGAGFELFTVSDGPDTLTFTLNGNPTLIGYTSNVNFDVQGWGTLAINGTDQTTANYTLDVAEASQGGLEIKSFTLDSTAMTPEPSSLALLGTSLLGAAAIARRRFLARLS